MANGLDSDGRPIPWFQPNDYGMNQIDPSSFGNFNYTGDWSNFNGGYKGTDALGDFFYTPFVQTQSSGGGPSMDGTGGHWDTSNQDGGPTWVADPYFAMYQTPDMSSGLSALDSARFSAMYGKDANLVNLTGNTNLPGAPSTNQGWGYMSRTMPEAQRHSPAHSSFDAIADFWMPVIGSAVVGGAGAWGALGGVEAGAAGAGALEAGALAGAPGYGAALEGSLAGLGAAGAGGVGLDPSWGANPAMDFSGAPIEEMGNFTGGGALGGNQTWGQLAQGLGLPNPSTLANGGEFGLQDIARMFNMTNADGSVNMGSLVKLLPNILGMLGSNSQTNAIEEVAKNQAALQAQAQKMGAPYRAQALGMLNDPNSFFSGKVAQDNLAGVLQGLSVNGNPFGNPTSLALAQQGQRGLYNNTLALLGQMGGLSGYNAAGANSAAQTQLQLQQAMSQGNMWNAAGAGLNTLLNPQPTLADLMKMLQGSGGGLGSSSPSNASIASMWEGLT